ncbi:hypothetical protein Bca52824_011499 [Brassica carinata]|uniref:Uncharacterized protein n=1 Tax=Brassica carinata TaxID=52824 RepID=A0A8X7WEU5_BRACI|nr:hypothetical protein Bca52824_011499 [Brassica carinata]
MTWAQPLLPGRTCSRSARTAGAAFHPHRPRWESSRRAPGAGRSRRAPESTLTEIGQASMNQALMVVATKSCSLLFDLNLRIHCEASLEGGNHQVLFESFTYRILMKQVLRGPAVVSPAKKEVVVKDLSTRPRKKARQRLSVPPTEAHEEASEEVPTEARSEVTTPVGGMTKEDIERCFKDIADAMREGFGTCLKEIKYLSDRVEAVEKKQSPYVGNSTAKVIIPNKKRFPGYNPFPAVDKKKLKELAEWLKTYPHYRTLLEQKPRKSPTWWYQNLRPPYPGWRTV